jgi:hypothetical protein
MFSEQERQKLVEYLNTFKGNESEVKIQIKTGKWSNAHMVHEKAIVETWLEEREKEKEDQRQKEQVQLVKEANANTEKANSIASQANKISERIIGFNKGLLIASIVAAVAAVISAGAAWMGANQQKLESRAQLRPYVLIKLADNVMRRNKDGWPFIPYKDPKFVTLPYRLKNVGSTPALKIRKGYTSYWVDSSDKENLIQPYREAEDKTDALLPSQESAIHMDQINISGFDPISMNKIRVDLEITYKGFSEVDRRISYSKARFVLIPDKMQNDEIGFYVSQPSLDFGFENKK